MSELLDLVKQQLGKEEISKISQEIGADEQSTEKGIDMALPAMVSALGEQAKDDNKANSLLNALGNHDGNILNNLGGFLNSGGQAQQQGMGILSHLFGGNKDRVSNGIGQASGIGSGASSKLLSMLAPILMGALTKKTMGFGSSNGLDLGSLTGLLGKERNSLEKRSSQGMGLLGSLLDKDGDGKIVDDLASGALGKLFR